MESHASAGSVRRHVSAAPVRGLLEAVGAKGLSAAARRLYTSLDLPIGLLLAGLVTAIAFVANGGLQLGSSTLVEVAVLLVAAVVTAAALLTIGFEARLHGGLALASLVALAGLTGLSILWSLYPSESWVETNRTLAYLAAFAAGIGAVRLARDRWPAILAGVLLGLSVVCLWGLATKIAPAWLAEDEIYGRLREPYGYWNAVGVTAAMGIPLSLWLGTRASGRPLVNALAWPLVGLLTVTLLLSFSRGSILAAAVGIAVWMVFVPLRLRSLALVLPSMLAAGAVTAWAFSKSALTDDRIALADRKDAGIEFGLILLAMILLLFVAGIAIQLRAERRPLSERNRHRVGVAAIAVVASLPFLTLGGLAFTDRGIGGTISDRWHDLTHADATPQNQPGRLTETSSVRSIYWSRAAQVWEKHPVAGAGAGSFAEAQLRFRKEQAQAKHAHGYVLQTLADLGLVGLFISLLALGTWLYSARETLALRRGEVRRGSAWSPERIGLATLAVMVIVFGVHSSVDWTWFVPAVAMTALFCAGWVAGRGSLTGTGAAAAPALNAVRASVPRGGDLRRRAPAAVAVVAFAVISVLAVAQPWRAEQKGDDALRLAGEGNYAAALQEAERARELNPLSVQPYFEEAAVEDAAGNPQAALTKLQRAVQLQPASPEAWRRLGEYYLDPLSEPDQALPVLRASLYLDPESADGRAAFVSALRASQLVIDRPSRPAREKPPQGSSAIR